MDTSLQLSAFVAQMQRTFDYMLGKGPAEKFFSMNPAGLWQALYISWICAALLGFFPGAIPDWQAYILFILTSITSSLLYALLVLRVLVRMGHGAVFLPFMVPYVWMNIIQVVIFALIFVTATATGILAIQLLYVPLAIWLLYWLIKVAKDQTKLGTFAAVGFLAGRVLVDVVLGWAAGSGFALPG